MDDGGIFDGLQEPFEILAGEDVPPKTGTDLGFRLWNVPKRRQLPKRPGIATP
jgi:hypothetical protein